MTTALPPDPAESPDVRPHRLVGLAGVLVWGLLAYTWLFLTLTLFVSGVSALPVAGSGVLLLVPWVLLMELAAAVERRRAVATHGLGVLVPSRRRSGHTGFRGWLHNRWLIVSTWPFWRSVLHHHLAMIVAGFFATLVLLLAVGAWTAGDIAWRHGPLEVSGLTLARPVLVLLGVVSLALAVGALVLGSLADRGLSRAMLSGSEEELREQVAELSQRRQGAVDAAELERRRIERDLHDGVQPRLVTLAMTLGMARSAIPSDPDRALRLVEEAHAESKAVITDLRQLARGIHPAVLTDRGLDAALSSLAARSPVPVHLDVRLDAAGGHRFDSEREAVAYFLVAEALTNVAKHAGAHRVDVQVTDRSGTLEIRIRDDGRGGAAVHRDGASTGLAGLTDRVRATGGRLEISSPPGAGTTLLATIPAAPTTTAAPAEEDPR